MSHKIYTTEAFVLRTHDIAETSKLIVFYTKDLGLIAAKAQGIRELKSKLRYSLQEFSFVKVSLVRGRELWRVTNVDYGSESILSGSHVARDMYARFFALLIRLVQGEEENEALFEFLRKTKDFVEANKDDEKKIEHVEIIAVLNLLYHLGYLSKKEELESFIDFETWTEEMLDRVAPLREEAIGTINYAFNHTQL